MYIFSYVSYFIFTHFRRCPASCHAFSSCVNSYILLDFYRVSFSPGYFKVFKIHYGVSSFILCYFSRFYDIMDCYCASFTK